jgi:hypothetical protein
MYPDEWKEKLQNLKNEEDAAIDSDLKALMSFLQKMGNVSSRDLQERTMRGFLALAFVGGKLAEVKRGIIIDQWVDQKNNT